jgi:hypothetical protein
MIRSSRRCFRTLLRTSFSLPQTCKPNCLKFRQPCSVDGKWRVDSLKFYFEILSSMSSIVNFTNSSPRQAPLMPKMSTTCTESLLLALFMYNMIKSVSILNFHQHCILRWKYNRQHCLVKNVSDCIC